MRLGFFGRTIVRSVIGFVIVIAAIIMITRATQRAVYDCLLIAQTNDATTEYMWDLTHNNIQSRTVPPLPIIQSHTAESLSPDNQHLAYIDPNPVNPNGPPLLGIQTFPSALTQEQSFGFYSTVYGGNSITWSPNGLWIAYLWMDAQGQTYLGIANRFGRILQTHLFSSQTGVAFDAWSSDSRYIALIKNPRLFVEAELSLWSVPTLDQIDLGQAAGGIGMDCYGYADCIRWSAQDHHAAYLGNLGLTMLTPGNGNIKTFELPNRIVSDFTQDVGISPDGRYAMLFLVPGEKNWIYELNLWDSNGLVKANVAPVVVDYNYNGAGPNQTAQAWTSDSKVIFYAEANDKSYRTILKLMAYHVETGTYTFFGTVQDALNMIFEMSPTDESAVFYTYDGPGASNDVLFLSLADGRKIVSLQPQIEFIAGFIAWSPDGAAVAIPGIDHNSKGTIVVLNRDGTLKAQRTSDFLNVDPNANVTLDWTDCRNW